MKKITGQLTASAVLLLPFSVMAHPGHGETEGFSIIHYFTEPVHATVTILGAMGVILLYRALRRNTGNKKA